MPPVVVFLAGLVVVVLGAELVLRSASAIARLLGVPPIIIGLTIVSIGTSAPELAVVITAVAEGKSALAVGNIAGTNIVNILFILGLSALIRPLPLQLFSIRLDVPVMIAATLILIPMAWDGVLSRTEGMILIMAAVLYTVARVRVSRCESSAMHREFAQEYGAAAADPERPGTSRAWNGLLLVGGIALTVFGAQLLVSGAVDMAEAYGVSDAVIGLTIVAIGTSAPELVTTLVATMKDDRDVAVGNLIGSSIYNILVILGLTCVVAPGGVDVSDEILRIDLPLAAAVALVCVPVFRSDRRVSRLEGALFVATYLLYVSTLLAWRA